MDNAEKVVSLIKKGAPIAGAAIGGALGFATGGPGGAAFGGGLGATLASVIEDTAERALSAREKVRVGATASYAINFVRERLSAGEVPREDGFFGDYEFGASAADEIFDGVLLKAKGDHEERKARYYGKFFSNVAFEQSCSRSEANYYLHLLDRLTYSQLMILAVVAEPGRFPQLPPDSYENKNVHEELLQTLLATFELSQIGLVKLWLAGTKDAEALLDLGEIRPKDLGLSLSGQRLFRLAGLELMAEQELRTVADIFASAGVGAALTEVSYLRNK